jgi:hypothetical protein
MTKALQKILILAQIGLNNETLFRCRQQTLLPARKAHFAVPTVARIEHSEYLSFIRFNSAAAHEMSTARYETASARGFLGFLLLKCSSLYLPGWSGYDTPHGTFVPHLAGYNGGNSQLCFNALMVSEI